MPTKPEEQSLGVQGLGERPSPQHTIERNDVNGNYEPDNCTWATWKEQQRNRRNNRVITAFGKARTLAEWAETSPVTETAISLRIESGMSPEEAILLPDQRRAA